MTRPTRWIALTLLALLSAPTLAATIWDEPTLGDLSNDGLNPTQLTLAVGSNKVHGTTGAPLIGFTDGVPDFGPPDRDYFTFTIGAGQRLDGIWVTRRTSPPGNDSFLGIELGNQVTESPNVVAPDKLWAYMLYGDAQFDLARGRPLRNLLLDMVFLQSNTAPSFLGPGTYAFWTQDTARGIDIEYELDFRVSQAAPVPVPGAFALMSGALAVLGACRRRLGSRHPA